MRKYGNTPFNIVVVHGGPGAPGYMAPVARKLSQLRGVLEPLQSADSVEGQVNELKADLDKYADLPVILIGSSWGAMLSFLFTARYPAYVKKLILVGSGAFENSYPININQIRMARLQHSEKEKVIDLLNLLNTPDIKDKNRILKQVAQLFVTTDSYDPETTDIELLDCQHEINTRVWGEVELLRNTGQFLELAKLIQCPVVAIHGDYDPHPAAGVQKPLENLIGDFRFIVLKNCGHYPWIEKQAKSVFYKILEHEIAAH